MENWTWKFPRAWHMGDAPQLFMRERKGKQGMDGWTDRANEWMCRWDTMQGQDWSRLEEAQREEGACQAEPWDTWWAQLRKKTGEGREMSSQPASQPDDTGSTQPVPSCLEKHRRHTLQHIDQPWELWLASRGLAPSRRLTFRQTGPNVTSQRPEPLAAWLGPLGQVRWPAAQCNHPV